MCVAFEMLRDSVLVFARKSRGRRSPSLIKPCLFAIETYPDLQQLPQQRSEAFLSEKQMRAIVAGRLALAFSAVVSLACLVDTPAPFPRNVFRVRGRWSSLVGTQPRVMLRMFNVVV